jgi:CxxC motif-containing protein
MREILCIVCPKGCRMQAEEGSQSISVTGNSCKRGEDFARAEIFNPVRTLTTTVRTVFPEAPVLPVRTEGEIPKASIPGVMEFLNTLTIRERLGIGKIAAANVLGLGRNVIITSNILCEEGLS